MQRYFGRETVFTLFTNVGSLTGCCIAVLAGTVWSRGEIHGPALIASWASIVVAISGLIGTVGSQVVNILKVISDHEITTKDIVRDMRVISEELKCLSIDVEMLKLDKNVRE